MIEPWDEFVWFVRERAAIALKKKLCLPQPWTDDFILRTGKFGNVWRELDRGTRWELDKIRGMPTIDAIELIMLYRHNLVPTTTCLLLADYSPEDIADVLGDKPIVHDVVKEWPGIHARAYGDKRPIDWARYVCEHRRQVRHKSWLGPVEMMISGEHCDAAALHQLLMDSISTLGPFKAYEVVTSMGYIESVPLSGDSLAHVGKGSSPTLELVQGGYSSSHLVQCAHDLNAELAETPDFAATAEGLGMPARLTLRAVEDCLCEWRKWRAVRDGSRKNVPRSAGDHRFS